MKTDAAVQIIAEAGVNHDGDLDRAQQLVDVAADAGADAVKFQTFRAENIATREAPKAEYQLLATERSESQFDMIRRLELSESQHEALIAHAKKRGIAFMSSPFDLASLQLLTGRFGLTTVKVASGEITNAPFLLAIARAAPRVIMSTGMSTLEEVEAALGVLAFGFVAPAGSVPRPGEFARAFASAEGQQAMSERVVLLHCTTEYPAPVAEVNLRAMDTMAAAFGIPVGYSDHTSGIHISLAAVARGARVIEKHFTLDRGLPGPDHAASLEPGELRELVAQVREIELALGHESKEPTPSELKNRDIARRSLVASMAIESGQAFDEKNIACKRPGSGVSPFNYWDFIGREAARPYAPDELLDA